MNSFDSMKIAFPVCCIDELDSIEFKTTTKTIDGLGTSSTKSLLNRNQLGIKSLEIYENKGKAVIEMSAKILYSDYLEGINLNTFQKAIENINELGSIKLNLVKTFDLAEVYRCDVTKNTVMGDHPSKAIKELSIYRLNPEFSCRTYGDKSIIFTRNIKNDSIRISIYDKGYELKLSSNKQLLSLLQENTTKNLLRTEVNLKSFKMIRTQLEIENIKLSRVLNSLGRPIETTMNEIKRGVPDISLIPKDLMDLGFKQIKDRIGWEGIINLFEGDYNQVALFIRSKIKGNCSKYLREAKPYCYELQIKNENLVNPWVNQSEYFNKLTA